MIFQLDTQCPHCQEEESCLSTSDELTCGACGTLTQVVSREEIDTNKKDICLKKL